MYPTIEREDWTLFASLSTLSQKAGVPVGKLRRLCLKEVTDNALDAGGVVTVSEPVPGRYVIEDDGPGIDGAPEDIARLFSINRPLVSSKLWRRPLRGALGNGLRVVAGALIASGGGSLVVMTRNQRLEITPLRDGGVEYDVTPISHPHGTRIEISFGKHLPQDHNARVWAQQAIDISDGEKRYGGRPSVWWHDSESFYALVSGVGDITVRDFMSHFDGCSGARAGEIAERFLNRSCEKMSREATDKLLEFARSFVDQVNVRRFGCVGKLANLPEHYAKEDGKIELGVRAPFAELPFVVEAWVETKIFGDSRISVFVNRTPIAGDVSVYHSSDKQFVIRGCGLGHYIDAPKKGVWSITLNIITPHMPITSDGKTPDLEHFVTAIASAIASAIRKAQRDLPKSGNRSEKAIFIDNLAEGVAAASGDGKYRFSIRQLFYALRKFVIDERGKEPTYANFQSIITDYESEYGEIDGMYRDDRGAIYQPHAGLGYMPLGTLMVEEYERPSWAFNKVVTIEKQGFFEVLRDEKFPERYDCALLTSKGFSSRACRDLIDALAAHDEPVEVFCIHDADAAGTMIYQTLQDATKARGARKIKIINIGLEPWEAEAMGLASETVEETKKRRPVADYVDEHGACADDGKPWPEWLQTNRYELNAMTTPQFLEWIEAKMEAHGGEKKVIPPDDVVADEGRKKLEARLREQITERILREANIDEQVRKAMEDKPLEEVTAEHIREWLEENAEQNWRGYLDQAVRDAADEKNEDDDDGE